MKQWRNIPLHDWVPTDKANTFPLMDYYVEPKFVWKTRAGDWGRSTKSIFEITNIPNAGQLPVGFLIEGKENCAIPYIHYNLNHYELF